MAKSFRSSFMACYGKPNPDMTKIIYICWQEEVCPKTGRHHWQTFVRFKTKNSILALQKAIGIDKELKYSDNEGVEHFAWKCHIKPHAKGTDSSCIAYCKKDDTAIKGTFVEHGNVPQMKPGKRTDIDQAVIDIREGKEPSPNILLKYPNGVKALKAKVNKDNTANRNTFDIIVNVFWGGAGTGKTKSIIDKYGQKNVYSLTKAKNEVWFDGYEQEKILIIDDFYGWIPWGELLQILDRYQLKLQIKGSYTWANWDKVFITSNKAYHEWYPNIENIEALERRINNTVYFKPLIESHKHKPKAITLEECFNTETTKPLSKSNTNNIIFKTIEESVIYHENIVNTLKDSKDDNDINMVKLSNRYLNSLFF